MTLHVTAGLLSCLANLPDHRDTDRAWEQIDAFFRRYNNYDVTMAKVPAWYTIELLCDQAMILHPNQKHEGRAYTKRMHALQPPVLGAAEIHSAEIHHKAGVGLAVPCAGVYEIEIYDDTLRKQSLAEVAPAEAMSLRFSNSEIDVFSNVNADDDFLLLDV